MLIWSCIVIAIVTGIASSAQSVVDRSTDDFRFVAYHGEFIVIPFILHDINPLPHNRHHLIDDMTSGVVLRALLFTLYLL